MSVSAIRARPEIISLPPVIEPIHSLTACRFLAALLVFLHHINRDRFYEGFCGVSFFFVLSGFILTYSYQQRFRELNWGKLREFYVARFARIYPVHILTFFVIIPTLWDSLCWQGMGAIRRALRNLALVHSFSTDPRNHFSYNAVSWTLSDECFFYLLLPFLLWALVRWRVSAMRAGMAILLLWIGSTCFSFSRRYTPGFHWQCYISPYLRVVDFTIGILLCRVFTALVAGARRYAAGFFLIFTLLEVGTLAGLAAAWRFAEVVPLAVRLASYYMPWMGALIFIFAFERGLVSQLLRTWPGRFLGEISFSFYMFHVATIFWIGKYQVALHLEHAGPRTRAAIIFATALAVSSLCYFLYETPLRLRMRRWLSGRRQPTDCIRVPGRHEILRPAA